METNQQEEFDLDSIHWADLGILSHHLHSHSYGHLMLSIRANSKTASLAYTGYKGPKSADEGKEDNAALDEFRLSTLHSLLLCFHMIFLSSSL